MGLHMESDSTKEQLPGGVDAYATRARSVPRPRRAEHLERDPRGYPILASIPQPPGDPDFGALSEQRKLALATFDLCAVCAMPFRDELRWQVRLSSDVEHPSNEAPVHEICGLYAAQVCPFVSSPYARFGDDARKGMRRPARIVLSGHAATVRVYGEPAPGEISGHTVLWFEMSAAERTHEFTSAADARSAYDAALADEAEIVLDEAEQEIVDYLCAPTAKDNEDSGGVMAGAAVIIGAAFCENVDRVLGMHRYFGTDSSYPKLAVAVTQDDREAERMETATPDPFTRAALRWQLSRRVRPAVLEDWRRNGLRRFRSTKGNSSRMAHSAQETRTRGSGGKSDAQRRRKAASKARRTNRKR